MAPTANYHQLCLPGPNSMVVYCHWSGPDGHSWLTSRVLCWLIHSLMESETYVSHPSLEHLCGIHCVCQDNTCISSRQTLCSGLVNRRFAPDHPDDVVDIIVALPFNINYVFEAECHSNVSDSSLLSDVVSEHGNDSCET